MNEPLGSDIANGMLYMADRDGGTTPTDTAVSVIRRFDMKTGAPAGEIKVEKSTGFNDIEVADDGTIYGTQTGTGGQNPDPTSWQVWKIAPNGTASIFVQGAPLRQPNGIAFDPQGNIVVINIGNEDVLTFSPDGKLLKTEKAAQAGNDGLVIMPDGTKYVSSVVNGGVSQDPSRRHGRAHRPEHPEPRLDVLRRGREPAGDPDERQQRARVHTAQVDLVPRRVVTTRCGESPARHWLSALCRCTDSGRKGCTLVDGRGPPRSAGDTQDPRRSAPRGAGVARLARDRSGS